MNPKDYQRQTRRFIHSATRWVCVFAAMFILCYFAASEALGQSDYARCVEAFKKCSACQQEVFQGGSQTGVSTSKEGICVVRSYGLKATDPGASEQLKACQKCLDGVGTPVKDPTPEIGQEEKRTCRKSFIISYDGQPQPKPLTVTKRFYDWTAKELEGYAEGGRYHIGQREAEQKKYMRGNYQKIKEATKKQDCAGYVMDQLWQTGPYFVTGENLYYEVIAKFGEKIGQPMLRWGFVQPNDIVVYGAGKHVAIVKEGPRPQIILETKDGEEGVYRHNFMAAQFDAF